jgi:hypothetical protein
MAHVVKIDSLASAWLGPPSSRVNRTNSAVAPNQPRAHHQLESGRSNQEVSLEMRPAPAWGRDNLMSETEASVWRLLNLFLEVVRRAQAGAAFWGDGELFSIARRGQLSTTSSRSRARSVKTLQRRENFRAGINGKCRA